MKKAVENTSVQRIFKGWNSAKLISISQETIKTQNPFVVTQAVFVVSGAKEGSDERITLTNKEDEALVDVCSMVLEAFGKPSIKVGDDPEPLLKACIGKECALLMVDRFDKKQGRTYLHTYQYGILNIDGEDIKAVLPKEHIGKKFDKNFVVGASGVASVGATPSNQGSGSTPSLSEDDVDF